MPPKAAAKPAADQGYVAKDLPRPGPVHADGIYFDLPEQTYRDDPALGSSDIRQLAKSPAEYWYSSWMNPHRPKDRGKPWLTLGTAIHTLAFHGAGVFSERYMRNPDPDDELSSAERAAITRAANKRAKELGKVPLPAEHYDRAAVTSAMIMKNPSLQKVFTDGASEVSVFWTMQIEGGRQIRKKARIDYLKARGLGDLKSCANQYERPFREACRQAISNYRYDVQAQHYMTARRLMPQMIKQGVVWNFEQHLKLLDAIVAAKSFAWQWVFYQSERAPLTWSGVLSPGNPILETAEGTIARAERNYLDCLERFGTEQWVEMTEPEEVFLDDMPMWFARD